MQSYIELIIAMMRTGILGFGGGPSVIPLIRHEAVVKYHWINDDEFGETLAIANALKVRSRPKCRHISAID